MDRDGSRGDEIVVSVPAALVISGVGLLEVGEVEKSWLVVLFHVCRQLVVHLDPFQTVDQGTAGGGTDELGRGSLIEGLA